MTSDQVKQVKEANDIVEVVSGYLALRPAGPTYKGLCPFHDDHNPSFDVDPRRQRYRCWSCGKYGDVIQFVLEYERVDFSEALRILARRANIPLDDSITPSKHDNRGALRETVRWAANLYHQCFLEDPAADSARAYVGSRKLQGQTARRFGVGFAPPSGDWLVRRAERDKVSLELLEKAGLLAKRDNGRGHYDRFRDRVLFPIRDALGRPVGFGGRILPESPFAPRAPKYYNSPDTPLFSKSEHLFGLDSARSAAAAAGFVAVVEGYTDVLMAHQCGIGQVVATMGTALTARHVHQLRRYLDQARVVLVYDADAGGDTGVDRALEIFASQEVDLAIATLPEGLDPCDLLVREGGPEQFRSILAAAADALDFKLDGILTPDRRAGDVNPPVTGVEGQRRAVDAVLKVIALAPEMPGQSGAVKRELIVGRIARRLALKEETVWARLEELRRDRRGPPDKPDGRAEEEARQARPAPEEKQLLEILLAEPALVPSAAAVIDPEDFHHPGLGSLLKGLYALHAEGLEVLPDLLDHLRARTDNPRLGEWVLKLHEIGRHMTERPAHLQKLLALYRDRRLAREKRELQNQLHAAADHAAALELLRQLQNQHGP